MQIEKLFYYTKVVEKGSISKAAEYLHISQQALSQSMCNLEKDLGVKLFSRHNKGIELLDDGERLYDAAQTIVETWSHFISEQRICNTMSTFSITIPILMEEIYSVSLLKFFETVYPNISLNIINRPYENSISALQNGEADLVMGTILIKKNSTEPSFPNVRSFELNNHKLGILVEKHTKLAKKSSVDFSDLKNEKIVLETMKNIEDYSIYKLLKQNGLNNISLVQTTKTMLQMVENGFAITLGFPDNGTNKIKFIAFSEELTVITKCWILSKNINNTITQSVIKKLFSLAN